MSIRTIKRNNHTPQTPWTRAINLVLTGAMILSLFGSVAPPAAQASQPAGDVIFNYPYAPAPKTSPTSPKDIDWNYSADHTGYDQAYTQAFSEQYNGGATPDHVVLSDDLRTAGTVAFYGYGAQPNMDYIFTTAAPGVVQGLSFVMHPVNMDFHTLSETGYLFNGQLSKQGSATYYTGYAVILSSASDPGMQESDQAAGAAAALRVYYLDQEPWSTENFKPGTTLSTRTLIATIKTGINNLDSTPYRVSVEIDPATRAFKVYVDGDLQVSVDATQVKGGTGGTAGPAGPAGFGFFTGYYAHSCTILTRISYENISIITRAASADDAPDTDCTVRFLESGTNKEIRTPETETGVIGQRYRIVQPRKITYGGATYYLARNSANAPIQSDLTLSYDKNAANNVTTLYYINLAGGSLESQELLARAPEKSARVNGGVWSRPATDSPAPVTAGSRIDYNITAYRPPEMVGRPMMTYGGMAMNNTSWWNQANGTTPTGSTLTAVDRMLVSTITFVDLPEHFDPDANVADLFLATYPSWHGRPVLRAWDATETTAVNPDRNLQRVVAWVTAGNVAGAYDVYVGGRGGVWMSAYTGASYLFNNFYNVTSIDFTHFHTDQAVNMSYMFNYFANSSTTPPIMDLSNFDTSRVTDMRYMFYFYAHNATTPPILDLTHFNTSRVTDMSFMFSNYAYATKGPAPVVLDLTHFDTSQVTNMSNMFNGFALYSTTAPVLDLTHFNTSRVTNMSGMFTYVGYAATTPVTLDLTHFDTSSVTDMSDMFAYFGYSNTSREPLLLDLTHFDTSRVTNMANMFRSLAYNAPTPPVLDLTHFDTSRVTNMSCMFQYYAYKTETPPDLDLSRFDTSKATSMLGMFSGYAYSSLVPFSLDLQWFKIGAAAGGTDVNQMFLGCPQLIELHLESGVFRSAAPATITNSTNMFYGRNANLSVQVGTAADQSWMQALSPAPPTVTVAGPPATARPAPRPVTLIPPLPVASPAAQTLITDVIPPAYSLT